MIEDKRQLSERCDRLHVEAQNRERKHQDAVRGQEQRHAAEVSRDVIIASLDNFSPFSQIRRMKSLHETSSKLKQEKWMDEKTKRIKEQSGWSKVAIIASVPKCYSLFSLDSARS